LRPVRSPFSPHQIESAGSGSRRRLRRWAGGAANGKQGTLLATCEGCSLASRGKPLTLPANRNWDRSRKKGHDVASTSPSGLVVSEESSALSLRLRPYTGSGRRILARKAHAVLADEMGLGKTVQAISAFSMLAVSIAHRESPGRNPCIVADKLDGRVCPLGAWRSIYAGSGRPRGQASELQASHPSSVRNLRSNQAGRGDNDIVDGL
jgi:hypothetical protein